MHCRVCFGSTYTKTGMVEKNSIPYTGMTSTVVKQSKF